MNVINKYFYKIIIVITLFFYNNCSLLILDDEKIFVPEIDITKTLLCVIDKDIYDFIKNSLNVYINDLKDAGCDSIIYVWEGGDYKELKDVLKKYYNEKNISGAFLIGNLPSAWYEMDAFGRQEQFPCDIYFMDFKASWTDSNNNNQFDSHTGLNIDIYTSRLIGTGKEINDYFKKNHLFRTGYFSFKGNAYIFKDDDWSDYYKGNAFGLNDIYDSILFREELRDSTKSNYVHDLTSSNAEYVYQWMHARPDSFGIKENTLFNDINIPDIKTNNFKGVFYNLYNCSASRFTEDNIAMTYLTKTNYCLATLGSTKIGGNHYPIPFNTVLSRKGTWGDAFKFWYKTYGVKNDEWFLGMIICGDPALKVSEKEVRYRIIDLETKGPPNSNELSLLKNIYTNIPIEFKEASFGDYREKNPQFFK